MTDQDVLDGMRLTRLKALGTLAYLRTPDVIAQWGLAEIRAAQESRGLALLALSMIEQEEARYEQLCG